MTDFPPFEILSILKSTAITARGSTQFRKLTPSEVPPMFHSYLFPDKEPEWQVLPPLKD